MKHDRRQDILAAAMELFAAGLGYHLHHCATVAGIFRLITVQDDFHFSDCVQRRDARESGRCPEIVADDAVDSQDIHAVIGAANIWRAGAKAAADIVLISKS